MVFGTQNDLGPLQQSIETERTLSGQITTEHDSDSGLVIELDCQNVLGPPQEPMPSRTLSNTEDLVLKRMWSTGLDFELEHETVTS